MEEKADGKGVCSKTLKFASRDLEEGNKLQWDDSAIQIHSNSWGTKQRIWQASSQTENVRNSFFLLQENGSQG